MDHQRVTFLGLGALARSLTQPPRLLLAPKSERPAPQRAKAGRDDTDIGVAIRRALAEVSPDSAARIVVISNGVSNRADPMAAAVAAGVPVDNVPLTRTPWPTFASWPIECPPARPKAR